MKKKYLGGKCTFLLQDQEYLQWQLQIIKTQLKILQLSTHNLLSHKFLTNQLPNFKINNLFFHNILILTTIILNYIQIKLYNIKDKCLNIQIKVSNIKGKSLNILDSLLPISNSLNFALSKRKQLNLICNQAIQKFTIA